MAQPWTTLEKVQTDDGVLELRRRGESDFLIMVDNRVLMNSVANRSELSLGREACQALEQKKGARVLIGGLGMGFTLRAALDVLDESAQLVVAELNPVIVDWCRGPLAMPTGCAVGDPRVTVVIDDVARVIAATSKKGAAHRFDTILLDLYEGPHTGHTDSDPLYGNRALRNTRAALALGGVFAVWGEGLDAGFVKRLKKAGFSVSHQRPGRGGLRHVVYRATAPGSSKAG